MGSFGNHHAEASAELFRRSLLRIYAGYGPKMIGLRVLTSQRERAWGLKPSTSLGCFSLMMLKLGSFGLVYVERRS